MSNAGQCMEPGPLSPSRIAERLGASKAMVHGLLQFPERGGYIEISREQVVLRRKLPPHG